METNMFQGSMVALVTPMQSDTSVDYASLKKLVEFHVDNQTDALISVGTTGESATLDEHEHCEVIAKTVEYSAGRIPVIAGTGANSTREAIQLTRCAAQAGADACLLVTPYYNKPTQEGLFRHYSAIADAVDIPQILYNIPGRTCCDLLPETVARLAVVKNIIGIKEGTGDLSRIRKIIELCGKDFEVYSGDDSTAMEAILNGARGDISVTANVAPKQMHEMCLAALQGDRQRAEALNAPLLGLHKHLFMETSPIPVKWALKEMGLISEGIRLPLTPFSASCHDTLRSAMKAANIL